MYKLMERKNNQYSLHYTDFDTYMRGKNDE